jgi:hypothetical protein
MERLFGGNMCFLLLAVRAQPVMDTQVGVIRFCARSEEWFSDQEESNFVVGDQGGIEYTKFTDY